MVAGAWVSEEPRDSAQFVGTFAELVLVDVYIHPSDIQQDSEHPVFRSHLAISG